MAPWFEMVFTVHPQDTDYGGVAWHGAYWRWLEITRIEALGSVGIEFADLVALGCDLPVIESQIRYRQPIPLGQRLRVRTQPWRDRLRLHWRYEILDGGQATPSRCFTTALVTLVPVDAHKRRLLRQLPPVLEQALMALGMAPG